MFLHTGNSTIYYDLIGQDKAPVVCMAHSLASDSGMWAEQVQPLLDGGFRVLRVDIRGHGGSEATPAPYTMVQLAGDIADVLTKLGLSDVHFVGLSIGGMMGLALALHYPAGLKSIMICDALAAAPPNAKELWEPRVAAVRQAGSLESLAGPTIQRWLSPAFQQRNPKRWQQIFDTIVGTSVEGFAGCAAALQDFDFLAQLPTIRLPTLVVCGANDPGAPPAASKAIAAGIPGARYEEIPDALHFPNVETPEPFNRILLDWCRRS
jgi:3-oxoadipate enol-lactonase